MADDTNLLPDETPDTESEEILPDEDEIEEFTREDSPEDARAEQVEDDAPDEAESTALSEGERVRQPRAQNFRRRLRNQISMLPLALFLLALGGYLIAHQQDVEGLPRFTTQALIGGMVLAVAFTVVFHALVFGRRERGLLFLGLWIWLTAGAVALLVYGIDDHPDVTEWWPLVVGTMGLAFVLTYLVERTHDARLVLVGMLALVSAGAAYLVTSGRLDRQALDEAAEYWPLLLSILGIGLVPLVFYRRTGEG